MNIEKIINSLGVLSVVASLLFVGLELRQSQRIAQAGQQQDRTASFFNLLGSTSEAGIDWQSVVMEVNSDYGEEYNLAEIVRRNIYHAHLFTYENDYFQYSQGLMPQELWDSKLKALAFFYNQCDMRELWTSRQQFFPSGYISIINTIPDECVE
ncbi:MAG: hypothetical protein CNF02_00515 [OM182 bacterium MED-G28]|uniref:Uncharacterized protein n=1 Tax=OM182 bacterium MED-G28 TaxID=1986256 RepID=A0A2A5WFD8_9GAMM|nr:MAG: hypothetical protein CNF02_00515 [OM182 bacterium MED-G28]